MLVHYWSAIKHYLLADFSPAFWPNLASTIIGVVVGVPIALWLTRRTAQEQDRIRQDDERQRLAAALRTVAGALRFNVQRLQALSEQLQNQKALFDVGLDTSAWDATRDEIIPFLRRPELQRRLSYEFVRLGTVMRLSRLYFDQVAGMAASLGGIERTREALRSFLINVCAELVASGRTLAHEIETEFGPPGTTGMPVNGEC